MNKGIIKHFNGQFGFIKYDGGDVFFHKSDISNTTNLRKGTEVEFNIVPSTRKDGSFQASDITVVSNKDIIDSSTNIPLIGVITFINSNKSITIKDIFLPFEYKFIISDNNFEISKLKKWDICFFEKKKNFAIKLRYACNIEDFRSALLYIYKDGYINININNFNTASNRGTRDSSAFLFIKNILCQILKNRGHTERLNIISNIFNDYIIDKSDSDILIFLYLIYYVYVDIKCNQSKDLKVFFKNNLALVKKHTEFYFKLWLEGIIIENDISLIAKQLNLLQYNFSNILEKVFAKLTEATEQEEVLKQFLSITDIFNKENGFNEIKLIAELKDVDEIVRLNFISSAFKVSNEKVKTLMWLNGFVDEIDLRYIANQLIIKPIQCVPIGYSASDSYNNFLVNIFKKISDPKEQKILLDVFLSLISNIDDNDKYIKFKKITDIKDLNNNVKTAFINSTFSIVDKKREYLMWLDGFVNEIDLENIADQFFLENDYSALNNYKIIFKKIQNPKDQKIILNKFLSIIGELNNINYNKFKLICSFEGLDKQVKADFLNNAFEKADKNIQFLMWYENYSEVKDLNYISKQIFSIKDLSNNWINPFEDFFRKIKSSTEQEIVFNNFLEIIHETNLRDNLQRVKLLLKLNNINKKVKKNFLFNILRTSPKNRLHELLLYFHDCFKKPEFSSWDFALKKHKGCTFIFLYFKQNEVFKTICKYDYKGSINKNETYIYNENFMLKDIESLKKIINENILRNEDTITYIKTLLPINSDERFEEAFTFCKSYKEFSDNIQFISSNFNYNLISDLINSSTNVDYLIEFYLSNLVETHLNLQQGISNKFFNIDINNKNFQSILGKRDICINQNLYYNYIENLKVLDIYDINFIIKELEVFKYHVTNYKLFDLLLLKKIIHPKNRMELWLSDLIDYFDFNNYCFYYFTLNLEQRKKFNQKARFIMGEELKQSMLRKCAPWELLSADENKNTIFYSATWKSIWFQDGSIRICMDNKPSFTKPYKWDFSEEKFNLLYEYISGKRLRDLKIECLGDEIKNIDGLDELEELIWKILIIKDLKESNETNNRGVGQNRIPVNIILRNQCLQFLNILQINDFMPSRILEKTFSLTRERADVDVSLLYSIPLKNGEITIIWESLELDKSKATHIFKCNKDEYEDIFSNIELFLSSNLKVRSALNSKKFEDVQKQNKLGYLCRIDHDNFEFNKWRNSLCELFPEFVKLII